MRSFDRKDAGLRHVQSLGKSPVRHSRESGLRLSAEPNIQRLQTFSHERPWMFGSAEVKQSPRSRE
ncbi:hypothetical protein [Lysobacter gummosus]|uniref:hypothetical protein n=1 Tax=Lysobacter gummosus TaxID=262324 RepID=UPI00363127E6